MFNLHEYFNSIDLVQVDLATNWQNGITYGFIFFFLAFLIGMGVNYGLKMLKF